MRHQKLNLFVKFNFFNKKLELLIIFSGIIIGLTTYVTNGFLSKSIFFIFLGFLGWDFGMRFLNNNDDDDDFDGGKMIPILQRS